MQKVSTAYKTSMKETLRERGYIEVTFHLVNQDAQENASIDETEEQAVFSDDSQLLTGGGTGNIVYATMEEDFTKVDGTMYFLPHESENSYYDTGLTSDALISEEQFSILISLNIDPIDIKGLSIEFIENCPSDFTITCDTGQVLTVTGNTDTEWYTDEVFEGITTLLFTFTSMEHSDNRLRINSITMGYDIEFGNDVVINSKLDTYVSPICEDIPQYDFFVQVANYDREFDVDNEDSAINYLENGQTIEVKYGYDTPDADETEWIEGQVLQCSDWDCDETRAVIYGTDFLRSLNSTYYGGEYRPGSYGKTFYSLAEDVLEDAGISDYYLDSVLKSYHCRNPLPLVTHKEALQLIANACRCILTQNRSGQIQIRSNYIPSASITSYSNETEYSNVKNILTDDTKIEYACFDTNYASVDGGMTFIPTDTNEYSDKTGYVSAEISDADGYFTQNPTLTITLDVTRVYYYIAFKFGYAIPAAFTIYAYNGTNLVNQYDIESDEIAMSCNIVRDFEECDSFVIEFTQTAEPYNHIVVDYIGISTVAMFTMEKNDMTSYPLGTKNEMIKEVVVPYYTYSINSETTTLIEDEFTGEGTGEITYYFSSAYANYKIYLDGTLMSYVTTNSSSECTEEIEDESTLTITEISKISLNGWSYSSYVLLRSLEDEDGNTYTAYFRQSNKETSHSCYFLTISYNFYGTGTLKIVASSLVYSNLNYAHTILTRGNTITWSNTLIYSQSMAKDLAEWLADYYASPIEYEYSTRGHPELDANDTIYQENEYADNVKVLITDCSLSFNGSFSGEITARRVVDSE